MIACLSSAGVFQVVMGTISLCATSFGLGIAWVMRRPQVWTGPDVPWAIRQTIRDCPYVTIADEHMALVSGDEIETWKEERSRFTSLYIKSIATSIPKMICGSTLWWADTGLTVVCTMEPHWDDPYRRHGWDHVARRLPEEASAR